MRGEGNAGVVEERVEVIAGIESALGSVSDVLTAKRESVPLLLTNCDEEEPGVEEATPKLIFPSDASLGIGMLARKSG